MVPGGKFLIGNLYFKKKVQEEEDKDNEAEEGLAVASDDAEVPVIADEDDAYEKMKN